MAATTTTTTAHAFPLPPCLAAAGVALVAGDAGGPGLPPSPLPPPGLHAWAEALTPSRACPPAAVDGAWREAVAGLVVGALAHPVGALLTPVRLPLPGDGGGRVLLVRSTPGALSAPAVAAWRGAAAAGGGEGAGLANATTTLLSTHLKTAAWAGLGVSLERRAGGVVAATFFARAAGAARPPTPAPLPLPACPARAPALTQRLVGGEGRHPPRLEVEAVVGGRACLLLQAPFPFRLGAPTVQPCVGGGAPARRPPPAAVRHRRTVDAPDMAVLCFAPGRQACVVVTAPLARLAHPLAHAGVGLVADRHARVALPPAVLVLEGGEEGAAFNATPANLFTLFSPPPSALQAGGGRGVAAVLLATSPDPAGARPAVVDETASELVLSLTAVLWGFLAAAMLQASVGARRRWWQGAGGK